MNSDFILLAFLLFLAPINTIVSQDINAKLTTTHYEESAKIWSVVDENDDGSFVAIVKDVKIKRGGFETNLVHFDKNLDIIKSEQLNAVIGESTSMYSIIESIELDGTYLLILAKEEKKVFGIYAMKYNPSKGSFEDPVLLDKKNSKEVYPGSSIVNSSPNNALFSIVYIHQNKTNIETSVYCFDSELNIKWEKENVVFDNKKSKDLGPLDSFNISNDGFVFLFYRSSSKGSNVYVLGKDIDTYKHSNVAFGDKKMLIHPYKLINENGDFKAIGLEATRNKISEDVVISITTVSPGKSEMVQTKSLDLKGIQASKFDGTSQKTVVRNIHCREVHAFEDGSYTAMFEELNFANERAYYGDLIFVHFNRDDDIVWVKSHKKSGHFALAPHFPFLGSFKSYLVNDEIHFFHSDIQKITYGKPHILLLKI